MNIGEFLAYGVSGLGLALAVLAYRLLKTEQTLQRPRKSMLNAIYVFMMFSLVLTAVGLSSEWMKAAFIGGADMPDRQNPISPAQAFQSVFNATKARVAGGLPATSSFRSELETGESDEVPLTFDSGECKRYLAMSERGTTLDIQIDSNDVLENEIHGREPHMLIGTLCAPKGSPTGTKLVVKLTEGSGRYAVETYPGTTP